MWWNLVHTMPFDELRSYVLATLRSLVPHFEKAEGLLNAVEAGLDYDTLLELAELLADASDTVRMEDRSEFIELAADMVAKRNEEENLERELEMSLASKIELF